ncbi:TonB-dependent receptor-like protein [Pseudoduganella flava]|uniref:TonB-dependent receptor n=1 Tax=Pseudoduganella flava TaxID=871742 RepID=A0A562Q0R8_9BURK|nr:TonB-dependent receptor [Pseudoduganella flava]QGZ38194.1 TonB-dependent receptor [Pseudoduganella flava]TWI50281.1 TonB-dependent receptor-like protein [Pseudoduganella flava]
MRHRQRSHHATRPAQLSAIFAAASLAGAAHGQEAQPPAAPKDDNTVVITGTRLVNRGFLAPTPVTVLDAQELKVTGTQNLETLLTDTPQFAASQLSSPTANTMQAGQPSGTATLNLRNLGPTRNLVLVNGRRFAITGPDFTTDINAIPAALVRRIETVTGGSSAVYGSDAISGVVNFIMRDNFQGVELNAQRSWDQPTKTPTSSLDLTVGGNFADNKGNAVLSLNYMNREGMTRGELGGYSLPSLGDGCVTAASWSATRPGTPLAVPAGQTCLSAGGRPGLIFSGSSTVPNGRIGNLPVPGSAASNPALDAALRAAGLQNMGTLGAIFDASGKAVRPYVAPDDGYDLGPLSYVVTPQKRWMGNAFAHYDFNERTTGYLEMHYSSNKAQVQIGPTSASGNFLVDTNNPYLSPEMREVMRQLDLRETGTLNAANGSQTLTTVAGDGRALVNLNRRLSDLGTRLGATDHSVFRFSVGVKGELPALSERYLSDLKYDVYYTHARTTESQYQAGSISLSRFQNALLAQNGAAPVLNPFGQNITQAARDAILISSNSDIVAEQQVLAGTVTGKLAELPAGPVDFSAGFERRHAYSKYTPDAFLSSGDVSGWNAARPTEGEATVKEMYGEARVPLLKDKPLAKSLSISGAFRRSDYDVESVGTVWTNSIGTEWAPVDSLTFRVQRQKSIRAPNVGELFGGQGRNGPIAIDPCSSRAAAGQQTAAVRAVCEATGVPANMVFDASVQPTQFLTQILGGNPNLEAETSHTTTIGAVFAPPSVRGLQLSVDWYRITLDNAISTLGGGGIQSVLDLCYYTIQSVDSVYCKAIHRDPVTGQIAAPDYVMTTAANIGGIRTQGLDLALHYGFATGWGLFANGARWNLDTNWTYVDELTFTPIQDIPDVKNACVGSWGGTCGQPVPKWKGTVRLTMNSGKLMLSARARYSGSVTTDAYVIPQRRGLTPPAYDSLTNPRIKAYTYLDLTAGWDFSKAVSVTAGVRNVTDKDPPVLGSTQLPANNSISASYDPLGRTFFAMLNVKM